MIALILQGCLALLGTPYESLLERCVLTEEGRYEQTQALVQKDQDRIETVRETIPIFVDLINLINEDTRDNQLNDYNVVDYSRLEKIQDKIKELQDKLKELEE